jgi:release factor glutamine methyltransferase
LQAARSRLAAVSEYPRRDAEGLLAQVLGCEQMALLTHPERALSEVQCEEFARLLERRLAAEPMQYLTGEQEFFGLRFQVSPDVLIPRPETEHLVEAVLERFARDQEARIVDVGTGSGAIAVTLAHTMPRALITAVDLFPAALKVARRNAVRHGVEERVRWVQADLLAGMEAGGFDAVVSNPPYVAEGEVLEPQVSRYEPHSALYAGPTGLEVYERLIPQAGRVLKDQGWLMMEIGYGQRPAVEELLRGWASVGFVNDLQGIARVAVAQKPSATLKQD